MAKKTLTPVAERMLEARTAAGLSQTKLAEAAGISQTTVANLENGRNSGETYFFALADALGVDARWLALGEKPSTKPSAIPPVATSGSIVAVAGRCELTYHSITALHDLCLRSIRNPPSEGDVTDFVILSEALRGIARDMENCTETLNADPGGLGYFAAHYGSI